MATIEAYQLANGSKRYRVRYRTPEHKQTDKRGFTTKKAAELFAARVEVSKSEGAYIPPAAGKVTVGTIYTAWSSARTRTKLTTEAKLESTWRTHLRDRWDSVAIGDVQTSEVGEWIAGLMAGGAKAATIETALGLLRMVLDAAVNDRRLARNPCTGVKPPRRKHQQRGYLTHEQVAALADVVSVQVHTHRGGHQIDVHRPEHATVVRFLAYTGLRWGEMAALKVCNFDALRRRVNVTEAVAEVRGVLVWDSPKTHERRSVPYPAFLSEPLAALMVGKGRDALVFTSTTGGVLRVSSFRPGVFLVAVDKCRAADPMFPRVTPHDMRHTAASLAISAGANVKAVQTMLGHKSAALTLDTYADLFPDDLDAVAIALNQAALSTSVGKMWARDQKGPASE